MEINQGSGIRWAGSLPGRKPPKKLNFKEVEKFRHTATSIPQAEFAITFTKDRRFGFGGIYKQVVKKETRASQRQSIKLELVKLKRSLAELQHQHAKQVQKAKSAELVMWRQPRQRIKVSKLFQRLSRDQRPKSMRQHVDWFGMRSSQLEEQRVTTYRGANSKSAHGFFSTTGKFDMGRPLNFNPGPGHYRQPDFLELGKTGKR